jgi:8-amino-7-oxononanoate synthase
LGCHGAAILGSVEWKDYLVNFAQFYLYHGLSPHSVATILYLSAFKKQDSVPFKLEKTLFFNQQKNLLGLKLLLSEANQRYNLPLFQ